MKQNVLPAPRTVCKLLTKNVAIARKSCAAEAERNGALGQTTGRHSHVKESSRTAYATRVAYCAKWSTFSLTKERDEQAAKWFLTKVIHRHSVPEKITIDGSAANEAAIKSYNE